MTAPPPYRIVYAPIAGAQIEAALLWWQVNRRSAPDMLARELDEALDDIAVGPRIGRRASLRGHPGARRLLLRRSQYHVYYVVLEDVREVRLVYFRHARRRPLRQR